MHYIVRARLVPESSVDLLRKLADGSIESQKPDGKEIVASMQRAVIDEAGVVSWSEVCYCDTPLRHERETVYDHYFTHIETEEVDDYVEFEGRPLLEYLEQQAK